MAYRRLPNVLAEHASTAKLLHTLRPFAVAMAGAGEFDPFKDKSCWIPRRGFAHWPLGDATLQFVHIFVHNVSGLVLGA